MSSLENTGAARKKVFLKNPAIRDIDRIRLYLEGQRPSAAAFFGRRLEEAWELLSRMPFLGRVARSTRMLRKGYRCFVMDEHYIYYKVTEGLVEVCRIVHNARNFGSRSEGSPV